MTLILNFVVLGITLAWNLLLCMIMIWNLFNYMFRYDIDIKFVITFGINYVLFCSVIKNYSTVYWYMFRFYKCR